MTNEKKIVFVKYEIYSSWWAGLVSNRWLQELAAKYYAWKVERKIKRLERYRIAQTDEFTRM